MAPWYYLSTYAFSNQGGRAIHHYWSHQIGQYLLNQQSLAAIVVATIVEDLTRWGGHVG